MAMPTEDGPPLILQADSELANQIQEEIKRKLQDEYSHAGSVETISSILPEYIKVIVCNAKQKPQVIEDLKVFLFDEAPRFVDWLWQMLADRNPARTHSAFSKRKEASTDDDMEVDRPRDFDRSGGVSADDLAGEVREQPNLKSFRSALQWATRDNTKRDRDREERRRERKDDRDKDRDRDRERRGDRDRRRRRKEDEKKTKKQDSSASTRFTITDSKGAGFDLPEGAVHLNVVPAVDRSLLTQPALTDDSQTKFTITLNKIEDSDIPNISHYNTPKPATAEEPPAPWWLAGKGGKGGKGVTAPTTAAASIPPWKQWSSGNMVYVLSCVCFYLHFQYNYDGVCLKFCLHQCQASRVSKHPYLDPLTLLKLSPYLGAESSPALQSVGLGHRLLPFWSPPARPMTSVG